MEPEEALEKAEASRQALLDSLDGLDDQEMTTVQVEGEWTIKDLIGHISAWEEVCLLPLKNFVSGGTFTVEVIEDHHEWNENQAALKQTRTTAELMKDLVRARLELLALLERLSEEQWEQTITMPWGQAGTPGALLGGLAWHEMEHAQSINRWREHRNNKQ